jgi:hypothetical protein
LADTFTGNAQPLSVEFSDCSAPVPNIAEGTANIQVISQFTYWACREYRSAKTKALYFRIEMVSDGEYVHLIPAHGRTAIDPMDYRYTTASVFQTCRRIRDTAVAASVSTNLSHCGPQ